MTVTPSWTTHSDLWFADGNVLLVATGSELNAEHRDANAGSRPFPIAFRVHAGVLTRASSVFSERLGNKNDFSSDISSSEMTVGEWDSCDDVLLLDDTAADVERLLWALYDGLYLTKDEPHNLAILGSVLRITKKYNMSRLYNIALARLCEDYPDTVTGWDAREHRRKINAFHGRESFAHPIHAIRLARELDLPQQILLCAFYDLARYPPSAIVSGCAPLQVPSGIRSQTIPCDPASPVSTNKAQKRVMLDPSDVYLVLSAKERTESYFASFLRIVIDERLVAEHCQVTSNEQCTDAFRYLLEYMLRGIAGISDSDDFDATLSHDSFGPILSDDTEESMQDGLCFTRPSASDPLFALQRAMACLEPQMAEGYICRPVVGGGACAGCREEFKYECERARERWWEHMRFWLELGKLRNEEAEDMDHTTL